MKSQQLISFVIPCYREAINIPLLAKTLEQEVSKLDKHYKFEFILVDDGSPDSTWQEIQKLTSSDTRYKGIHLSRNFGHQAALTA